MKYSTCAVSMLILFLVLLTADKVASQISGDAIILTLRMQEGIALDLALARDIDSSLAVARTVEDSLAWIHAFPDYIPKDLLLKTSAVWADRWRRGELWTGDPYIDSLGRYYLLARVDTLLVSNWFVLRFNQPLHARRLATVYRRHPDVIYAEANSVGGDGNRIEFFRKNSVDCFAFSHGWEDCFAGCIFRFYWYVAVRGRGADRTAQLEESRLRSGLWIYRWNIPPFYAMTMFPSVDSILATVRRAPEWWVRRHAIEGIWRFFVYPHAWARGELSSRWDSLKSQLAARRGEVLYTLQLARADSDLDVRASADTAIMKITTLDVTVPQMPTRSVLFQNYPNPFNPSTTISFSIPAATHVRLTVHNTLGQEVATVLNSAQPAGTYSVDFTAMNLASGVYFYRIVAGSYRETKKMVLMR